jgi:large subunit ribosomal protein L25
LHLDLLRVSSTEKLHMRVPLHFMGAEGCPGVKLGGGVVSHPVSDVEISCLPADLPEFLEIDMSMLDLGESLHLSDISVPKGVEITALAHGVDHDFAVAAVYAKKGGSDEDEEETTGEAEADGDDAET